MLQRIAQPTSLARIGNAELAARQERALESALRAGFAGLIVWGRGSTNSDGSQDLLYLTNHMSAVSHIPDSHANRARGHAALILAPDREPILVTDSYDIDRSEVSANEIRLSTFVDRDTARVAAELGLAGQRIGLAGQAGLLHSAGICMSDELGDATQLIPADHLLTKLRLIKSEHEVKLLREASRIGSDWMQVMIDATHPGRTEGEIVGEGLRWLAASGGFAYDVAVASGPFAHRYRHRQALPTWDSGRRIEKGDMIHFDVWGPVAQGYYCDMTRSTVVGAPPTDAQSLVLESSVAVVEDIIAEIEPGRHLADLHAAGARAVVQRGAGKSDRSAMIPFFGHSLGLDCEAPFITPYAEEKVEPGMVLAVECFIGGGRGEGAGFEHVLHVGESGIEILTATAKSRPWLGD